MDLSQTFRAFLAGIVDDTDDAPAKPIIDAWMVIVDGVISRGENPLYVVRYAQDYVADAPRSGRIKAVKFVVDRFLKGRGTEATENAAIDFLINMRSQWD